VGEFFSLYALFIAKAVTVVVVILLLVAIIASCAGRNKGKKHGKGRLVVTHLNKELEQREQTIKAVILSKAEYKQGVKQVKKQQKQSEQSKETSENAKKRIYVVDFSGDIKATAVASLRQVITAVLTTAKPQDEFVLCLESAGGLVHSYGLAASQLDRVKRHGMALTVCVDKVAASGGYLMACVAHKILAAPFAVIGSIGVVAQLPNFNRLLKKNNIDLELHTAGQYKRTLTLFGENTDQARAKFKQDLADTHELFKAFVSEHRSQLDLAEVATGEHWFGRKALGLKLVDELKTSDEYLLEQYKNADLYQVSYQVKKSLADRFSHLVQLSLEKLWGFAWQREQESRFS
jgi:serine protease SohB